MLFCYFKKARVKAIARDGLAMDIARARIIGPELRLGQGLDMAKTMAKAKAPRAQARVRDS